MRYSAGGGTAKRKLELDGSVWVAAQSLPATASWSTWTTLTLNTTLSAGPHTLKVWYDSTSGSTRYINLDNLTVTQVAPPPPPAAPTNTTPPAITGNTEAGSTLTAAPGVWSGNPDTFTYQWNRCTPDCAPTSDTTPTYLLTTDDIATTLTVTVTATNTTGPSQPATSPPTATITAPPPPTPPANTTLPAISGVAQTGSTLTAAPGTWSGNPDTFTYQWNRCTPDCAPTSDTTPTYLLTTDDIATTLTVTVTATNTTGPSQPATSPPTATITAAPVTKTIAAGASDTNLPTESKWPGAQNPPYICCWGKQGQYVTFSFDAGDTPTALVLRYSAGGGDAVRTLELDGAVWVAAQTFPATSDWNSWTTLPLSASLPAGPHTLTVLFDSSRGSSRYINLDNLEVSPTSPPPDGVVVALGYADSASGLTPWAGSPGTTFVGTAPQCCATHGPDNGNPSYDSGAIEIDNTGTSSVVVDSVSVEFGGGSSPSSISLWGSGQADALPHTLLPGENLVLTMTAGFNFDASDLLGEACHPDTGVVPVVHVTLNGALTDYRDSHQILNTGGADLASCPRDVSEQTPFTTVLPGDQPAAAPVNIVPPALAGTAMQGRVLSGIAGGWSASPPPALAFEWLRCDADGINCTVIPGADTSTYIATLDDVGSALRFAVTASNDSGGTVVLSPPTSLVLAGAPVGQLGNTSTGFTSTDVSNRNEIGSLFTASASGTAVDLEFFARGARNDQAFTPNLYEVAADNTATLLATGAAITVPRGSDGQWYVSDLPATTLQAGTRYYLALDPSGAPTGTYVGSEMDGTLSVFVDYTPLPAT